MAAMTGKLCRGCGREFGVEEQFCPDDGSRLSTASQLGQQRRADPLIGQKLDGRYQILRVIGEGGMGVVYEAQHVLIEKHVAIKVLRDTFTHRPDVVERFRQEAKSASKIGHPNIVDVSDFGETLSGQSYIVMEMLSGEDLADLLARERVLPPARAVRLVFQVARALHATHKKNIVHRDLKPENIYLIERDGTTDIVKVVDFGVAKMSDVESPGGRRLTRTGMIFGTPEYMSPEQALGKPFDHRVDIYALGAIFFELLTGRVPFEGDNFMEILAKHGHARVPTLREVNPTTQVSSELERIVMRTLCKDPAERYQSMGDLANELRATPEMPSLEPGEAVEAPVWALRSGVASDVTRADRATRVTDESVPARLTSEVAGTELGATFDAAASSGPAIAPLAAAPGGRRGRHALSTDAQPAPRTTRHWLWAAAALVAIGVGAVVGWQRTREPQVSVASLAPHVLVQATPLEGSVSAATASEAPPREAQPTSHAESALVEVQIRTRPSGASVQVVGSDLRCEAAPCALALPRGRAVTLRAQNEAGSVERTLTFDAANRQVQLRLSSLERSKGVAQSATAAGIQKPVSDLKVPAIFR